MQLLSTRSGKQLGNKLPSCHQAHVVYITNAGRQCQFALKRALAYLTANFVAQFLYRAKTTWPTGRNAAEEQYHDSATGTFCQFATAHKKATTGVAISTAHLERPRRAQGSVAWRCSSLFHKETSSHGPLRWFLQLWLTVLYSSQHIVSQGVPQRTTPKCWVRLSSFVAQPCGLLLSPFF